MTDDGRKALADRLLTMAARRSVETTFGWAHPDCADLQQAARVVRGDDAERPRMQVLFDAICERQRAANAAAGIDDSGAKITEQYFNSFPKKAFGLFLEEFSSWIGNRLDGDGSEAFHEEIVNRIEKGAAELVQQARSQAIDDCIKVVREAEEIARVGSAKYPEAVAPEAMAAIANEIASRLEALKGST